MKFEQLEAYKQIANMYKGEELDTNTLAEMCRESSPREWMTVNGCNKSTWVGEERKEVDGEIWVYRSTKVFDPILYSMLILRFEKIIYSDYKKVNRYCYPDEYFEEVEDFFKSAIVRYDREKGYFSTLAFRVIYNATVTLMRGKKITTNVDGKNVTYYRDLPSSLDEIMDNKENPCNYLLPNNVFNEVDAFADLKDQYKRQNDFVCWAILDWRDPNSELLQNKKVVKSMKDNVVMNCPNMVTLCNLFIENKLFSTYGFDKCRVQSKYDELDKLDITTKEMLRKFNAFIRSQFRFATAKLRSDVSRYCSKW